MNQNENQNDDERRFVSFYLNGQRFAVDIVMVREVHRPLNVTPARGADSLVRGIVNLRGQIITVLDPAQRLGFAPRELTEDTRLVILKTNSELRARGVDHMDSWDDQVAWWVDSISDVVVCRREEVEPPAASTSGGLSEGLLSGVIQLPGGVVRVLDAVATVALEEAEA